MAETELKEKVVEYVQDAQSMEQQVLRMLDSMIANTRDPEIRGALERHRAQTEAHDERLRQRLEAMGKSPSAIEQAATAGAAAGKGILDQLRSDKPAKTARDGYMTEHMEIAAYELLERIALRAGDPMTAEVAQRNLRDEEEMARRIASQWDRIVELTLQEEGVRVR